MDEGVIKNKTIERRTEHRIITDKYYSVEFAIKNLSYVYQLKLWNISSKGICSLIKENSDILNYLHMGDVLNMKYYPMKSSESAQNKKTEIKHITKYDQGRYKGHCLVGILILE